MSAFSNASPSERFKISEIAIKRLRKRQGDRFEWAAFAALREQVAREQLRSKPWLVQRIVAALCDKLIVGLIKFRFMVLKD